MYRIAATAILLSAVWCRAAFAVTIGQIDTFQDGTTAGWFAGSLGAGATPPVPPRVEASGGPGGAGDAFLVVTAQGGQGPGSRLVAMNSAQWAGNYLEPGFGAISMHLRNLGTSDLAIRLLFEDPAGAPPANEAVSSIPVVLAAGSGWTHAVFPIRAQDFTALNGTVEGALGGTTLLRIFHAPETGPAVPVAGVLGIDNIAAVPEPGTGLILALGLLAVAARRWRRYFAPFRISENRARKHSDDSVAALSGCGPWGSLK